MEDISDRASTLERMRALKMARSTHAYVRGNTIKFYQWLAMSRSAARLPSGPPVWICGDCLGRRMLATCLLGKPIVLRELLPQDLKLEVDQFSRAEATKAARYLAYVVGVAHARQMNRGDRRAWRRTLAQRPLDDIDAPSWLWGSVVDLTASHEAGYLEHCRRYALSEAA